MREKRQMKQQREGKNLQGRRDEEIKAKPS